MYRYNAKVVRVIDGDTVVLDIDLGFGVTITDESIRMYGINAPESRTRDLVEKEKGLAAKEYIKTLLAPGDSVILRSDLFDKRGKYGRILGTIIVSALGQEMNVNDKMISEGHAVPYFGGKR